MAKVQGKSTRQKYKAKVQGKSPEQKCKANMQSKSARKNTYIICKTNIKDQSSIIKEAISQKTCEWRIYHIALLQYFTLNYIKCSIYSNASFLQISIYYKLKKLGADFLPIKALSYSSNTFQQFSILFKCVNYCQTADNYLQNVNILIATIIVVFRFPC